MCWGSFCVSGGLTVMANDERWRAEPVPYPLAEDEIVDDNSDFELIAQRFAPPAPSRRRRWQHGRSAARVEDRGDGIHAYLTPKNLIASAIAMGLGFWAVTSNVFISSAGGQGGAGGIAAMSVGEPAPFPVTVRTSQAVRHDQIITVRGRTEAGARVAIKAETAGIVETIVVGKGLQVKQGDALCTLQRGARDAALAEAKAQLARAQLDAEASSQLPEGAGTKLTLAGSKAALDAAQAAVKTAEIELLRTRIAAPFSGILEEQPANTGDLLSIGSTCAVLLAPDPIYVVGAVTEREVGRLRRGMEGVAQLATGEKVAGIVRFVGSAAEQTTRTFRVELEVANPEWRLRDGVTATMRIPVRGETAHQLPPSALTLNDAGQLGVRVVERGDMAQFRPVKVVSDERDGVWVSGLPREVTVIVAGQDFVTDGQRVSLAEKRAPTRP
jgi:multidrug efflux system membrane fusion protein